MKKKDKEITHMFNQVLVTVLNKIELLDKLLDEFEEAGVSGATVISSIGMAHALAGREESHFISSFRAFFDVSHSESKTIFIVCSDEMAEKAKEAVRKIVGDLNEPDSAIMFSVPLLYIEGISHSE